MAEDRDKAIQLPKDRSNSPVQVLGISSSETAVGTVGGSSSSVQLPSGSEVVEFASLTDCHFKFGTSGVTAATTDPVFPKGAMPYKILPGQTHVAVILASGASSAKFSVTRLK